MGFVLTVNEETYKKLDDVVGYHAAKLFLSTPSTIEHEDLVAEGWLAVAVALKRYDEDRDVLFSSFARPFIRGGMLDYVRNNYNAGLWPKRSRGIANRRLPGFKPHLPYEVLFWNEGSDGLPDRYAEMDLCRRAMGQIPPRGQEVVRLRYYEGLSNVEMARVLNIGEAAVSRRLKRALHLLTKVFKRWDNLMSRDDGSLVGVGRD